VARIALIRIKFSSRAACCEGFGAALVDESASHTDPYR
jgi:hypothetical protein